MVENSFDPHRVRDVGQVGTWRKPETHSNRGCSKIEVDEDRSRRCCPRQRICQRDLGASRSAPCTRDNRDGTHLFACGRQRPRGDEADRLYERLSIYRIGNDLVRTAKREQIRRWLVACREHTDNTQTQTFPGCHLSRSHPGDVAAGHHDVDIGSSRFEVGWLERPQNDANRRCLVGVRDEVGLPVAGGQHRCYSHGHGVTLTRSIVPDSRALARAAARSPSTARTTSTRSASNPDSPRLTSRM